MGVEIKSPPSHPCGAPEASAGAAAGEGEREGVAVALGEGSALGVPLALRVRDGVRVLETVTVRERDGVGVPETAAARERETVGVGDRVRVEVALPPARCAPQSSSRSTEAMRGSPLIIKTRRALRQKGVSLSCRDA
jgi:hypothetical protein